MTTESMPGSMSTQGAPHGGHRSAETQIVAHPKTHEVLGILGIAIALFLLASLLSYNAFDPSFFNSGGGPGHQVHNYGGRWGAELSGDLLEILGVGALALPFFLVLFSSRYLSAKTTPGVAWKLVGCVLLLVSLGLLAQLCVETGLLDGRSWERPGGFVGEELHRIFSPLVGRAGLPLLGLTSLLLGVVCLGSQPLSGISAGCQHIIERVVTRIRERQAAKAQLPGRIRPPYTPAAEEEPRTGSRSTPVVMVEPVEVEAVREPALRQLEPPTVDELPPQGSFPFAVPEGGFQNPPLALLDLPTAAESGLSDEEREANAAILERKLLDFGVEGRVTQAQPGPVITRYEIEPGPGGTFSRRNTSGRSRPPPSSTTGRTFRRACCRAAYQSRTHRSRSMRARARPSSGVRPRCTTSASSTSDGPWPTSTPGSRPSCSEAGCASTGPR